MAYSPPLTITPRLITLVSEISELIGHLALTRDGELASQLRRGNRIRTIQASLAIENNTLTLEQVTAVLEGKRVLGLPKEIQEVRNAFAAYEAMAHWQPTELDHLLQAHRLLMQGLIDEAGLAHQPVDPPRPKSWRVLRPLGPRLNRPAFGGAVRARHQMG